MKLIVAILFYHTIIHAVGSTPYQEYANFIQSYLKKSHLDINPRCYEHLEKYARGLKNTQTWALKMFDATSHTPKRIFSRKNTDLGDFDQCLDIEHRTRHETISGKYCTGRFEPKTMNSRFSTAETNTSLFNVLSVCFPNGCFEEEIEQFWSGKTPDYSVTDVVCQTKMSYSHFTTGYVITRMLLIIYFLIVMLSSTYDIVQYYKGEEASRELLIAFSVFRNGRKLFSMSKSSGKISCLDGIRVLGLMWIIAGHRFYLYYFIPIKNVDDFVNWYNNRSSIILTHSFALNVDSFLLMGGAVATYTFLKNTEVQFPFDIVSYYFKRFLRLTPPLAVVILIHVHVFRFLGSGPLWPLLGEAMNSDCQSYWWSALLYLQNYVNPLNTCVVSTWYLSVDMQMYILSPFILIALKKWPRRTLMCIIIACMVLIFSRFNLCLSKNILSIFDVDQSLSLTSSTEIDNSFSYSYAPTHMRAPTWLMGVIVGYLLHQRKRFQESVNLSKFMVGLLWVTSVATLAFCTFSGNYLLNQDYDRLSHALHQSLNGPMWTMAIFCTIIMCAYGYGGPINSFLSLPVFEFLAKLSYCMFITHFSVLQFRMGEIREAVTFSLMDAIDECIADYIFTIFVAVMWHLMFEAPIGVLQNLYSKRTKPDRRHHTVKEHLDDQKEE